MSRSDNLAIIKELYPIDSEFEAVRELGLGLLFQSVAEFGWENLPDEVLEIYANKCKDQDYWNTKNAIERRRIS